MVNWTLVVASFGAVVATFDIYWFLRLAYTRLVSFVRKPMAITDVSRIIYISSYNRTNVSRVVIRVAAIALMILKKDVIEHPEIFM